MKLTNKAFFDELKAEVQMATAQLSKCRLGNQPSSEYIKVLTDSNFGSPTRQLLK